MTPARKSALQWFHDQGEVSDFHVYKSISPMLVSIMVRDGHVEVSKRNRRAFDYMSLTDKGRRALHGDSE